MTKKDFIRKISMATIVYIEDDINVRKYIVEFLDRYCNNIYEASSAEEGLKLYKKYKPQILLVDINLPGMSGMEFVSLLRKKDKTTRIIISTAYTNKEFTLQAIEMGLTRYLVKPITSTEMVDTLKKAFEELDELLPELSNIDLGESCFYNIMRRELLKSGEKVDLRKKEQQILEFLIDKRDEVISYETLENEVWQNSIMTENSIRSQIRNLRSKTHKNIVTNVSGRGYKLFQSEEG